MNRRRLLHTMLSFAAVPTAASAWAQGSPTRHASSPDASRFAVAADGTRLFVRSAGSGRPIVFVSPWGLNADWWEYQTIALADSSLRCITFDRRGHARSDEPVSGYDFETLAADIGAVIEQLDLRNVLLIGQSMGAAEAVRYLSRFNQGRVTRAALIATTTPFILKTGDNPDGADAAAIERGREAFKRDRAARIADGAAGFFGAPANPVSPQIMDWWTRMMVDRCSMRVMLDLHRVMTNTDFRAELTVISVPTAIIHGDRDTSAVLEKKGRSTHQLIPGSTLTVYEGAAHGLPYTHMDRLNAELRALAES